MDILLNGVHATPPNIQGTLRTMYDIMKISWASWSSVDVIYTHPPHANVLMIPETNTHPGKLDHSDLWQ
jgi:hypothetical protein